MRLGIYVDLDYHRTDAGISTDQAVIRFLTGLAEHGAEPVFFGRLKEDGEPQPYPLPHDTEFVPLPHYGRLSNLPSVAGAIRRSVQVFSSALDSLDAVWLFGPHPLSFAFAAVACRRGVPTFLGVRQVFPRYVATRLPASAKPWAMPAAWLAEAGYRQMARRLPTVVVGDDLGRRYKADKRPVLKTGFSLIRESEIANAPEVLANRWNGELRLLTVGRLDPEKNPVLLPDILARLLSRDRSWRLAVAGEGSLENDLRRRAEALGVNDRIEMLGHVRNGPDLRAEYQRSAAFLHVSFTEGLPQVLFEAHAAGLPIVATEVGGVGAGLEGGRTGLLIPPDDAEAAAQALERLRDDAGLRAALIERGLTRSRQETFEAQAERILDFFRSHLGPGCSLGSS